MEFFQFPKGRPEGYADRMEAGVDDLALLGTFQYLRFREAPAYGAPHSVDELDGLMASFEPRRMSLMKPLGRYECRNLLLAAVATVKRPGHLLQRLLAIWHDHVIATGCQTGQGQGNVVLLPVAYVDIEIVRRHDGRSIHAGVRDVTRGPPFDSGADFESAVSRQATGLLVCGDTTRDRVSHGNEVFGSRPEYGSEQATCVGCLGSLL